MSDDDYIRTLREARERIERQTAIAERALYLSQSRLALCKQAHYNLMQTRQRRSLWSFIWPGLTGYVLTMTVYCLVLWLT